MCFVVSFGCDNNSGSNADKNHVHIHVEKGKDKKGEQVSFSQKISTLFLFSSSSTISV